MNDSDDAKSRKIEKDDLSSNNMEGLNPSVKEALENLGGNQGVYGEDKVKKLATLCIKYLQEKKEVPRRDLKMSIYLKFLESPEENTVREMLRKNDDLTEKDIWEMTRSALDVIEKRTDVVEITETKDDRKYRWKK